VERGSTAAGGSLLKSLSPRDRDTVRRAFHFNVASDDLLERLLSGAQMRSCRRGQVLFLRGEPARSFFLVLDGWVKIFRDTAEGEQTVVSIIRPGETFAQAAIFAGINYPASAEVVADARLIEIPGEVFVSKLRENPDMALRMLGTLSMHLHHLVQNLDALQSRATHQRLAEFLLSMCDVRDGKATIELPYDKSLVAARLGMKPESLSRALRKLRGFGVRTVGSTVEIANVSRLREACE
jgi:CRP-like cAMP-binding protein